MILSTLSQLGQSALTNPDLRVGMSENESSAQQGRELLSEVTRELALQRGQQRTII